MAAVPFAVLCCHSAKQHVRISKHRMQSSMQLVTAGIYFKHPLTTACVSAKCQELRAKPKSRLAPPDTCLHPGGYPVSPLVVPGRLESLLVNSLPSVVLQRGCGGYHWRRGSGWGGNVQHTTICTAMMFMEVNGRAVGSSMHNLCPEAGPSSHFKVRSHPTEAFLLGQALPVCSQMGLRVGALGSVFICSDMFCIQSKRLQPRWAHLAPSIYPFAHLSICTYVHI